jgi:hypothetical protein
MAADAQNSPKPLVYVSYAWGDETNAGREREQIVDELCQALEKYDDIIVGRDKRRQKIGDSIEGFAADISKAEIILAVISKKYLRSYHCMVEELYQAYCRSFSRKEEFNKKVCLLLLDDAIDDINVSQELIDHWLDVDQELNSKLLQIDPDKNSRDGWETLKNIKAMKSLMIDMLSALTDSVMPRGYKQIKRNDFQELRDLIRRRLNEWYQWRDDRSGFIPEIEDGTTNGTQFEGNDLKQQFLALVFERGQKLVDDPKWAEKECPWEVRNYKWESLLFNPQLGRYLTVDLQADIGSYLVAKQTVNNSLSTATECSTFGDLLQAAVSWINKHSSACVLELFVPTELLLFDWSAIKISGRSEYAGDECLYEQHPYVLRSLDRFSDANLSSRLKQMPLKYRALAAGNGRWIAGDSAASRTMLKESETKPEFVALKCISHLDTDPLNRLRWHRSVVEAMMPLALWWRDQQENCQDDLTSHLDR